MSAIAKVVSCEDGFRLLCEKYMAGVDDKVCLQHSGDGNPFPAMITGGKNISLLPWRYERRFIELRNLLRDGTVQDVSTFRICHIEDGDKTLNRLLYRELDLVEWLSGSIIESVYAIMNGDDTAVLAVKLASQVVCTVELSTRLAEGSKTIDKHEIVASKGVAIDRVVDTQIPQSSIYLFSDQKNPQEYTDVDYELYGLAPVDVALVRCAFEAIQNGQAMREMEDQDKRLQTLISLVMLSIQTKNKVNVGDKV